MNVNKKAQSEPIALKVHNGTYTVRGKKGHRTFRVETVTSGDLRGKRIISMLVGFDNVADFLDLAFWDDEAETATVWRKHRPGGSHGNIRAFHYPLRGSSIEKAVAIFIDLAVTHLAPERGSYWRQEGYELLVEGTCVRCNRPLTTPESIEAGIGPVCAEKGAL